jgi:hypothetical protein
MLGNIYTKCITFIETQVYVVMIVFMDKMEEKIIKKKRNKKLKNSTF